MPEFTFLSDKFYQDFAGCSEIEQKKNRPYIQVEVVIDGVLFGVPLRSNIRHPHVLWTDKKNLCGIDFSKAVVISDRKNYIDMSTKPYIRPSEFRALKGKEFVIEQRLKKYIKKYDKAKKRPDLERNRKLLKYSTLQYFEDYVETLVRSWDLAEKQEKARTV